MLLNLFIAILIENFEQLSVRHNFSKQLRKVKSAALHIIIYEWIVDQLNNCRGKKVKPGLPEIKQLSEEEAAEVKQLLDLRQQ